MRLLNKDKFKSIYQRLFVYIVEIVIIFVGITISFLFEQWREENRQKQELIHLAESLLRDSEIGKAHLQSDLGGTNTWIMNLDSIRIQRDKGKFDEKKLMWFYNLLNGTTFGLFDSKSPAYLSAISSGMLTKLPDSIQLKIYDVYEARLPDFQYLYNQQTETVKSFRNDAMIHTDYLYISPSEEVTLNLEKFAKEVQRPVYGNLVNQIIVTEKVVRRRNIKLTDDFESISQMLRDYIKALKSS